MIVYLDNSYLKGEKDGARLKLWSGKKQQSLNYPGWGGA